jgi:hypothetical protein
LRRKDEFEDKELEPLRPHKAKSGMRPPKRRKPKPVKQAKAKGRR